MPKRWADGRRRAPLSAVLLLGAALLGAGCAGGADAPDSRILATTSVIGDLVSAVAGEDAIVDVLIPVGADPHDHALAGDPSLMLGGVDLIVAVGLDLEVGLADLLAQAASSGVPVLRIGPLVEPDWIGDSLVLDPHVWMDPTRMALAADLVAAEMERIGLDGDWATNAAAVRAEYEALDAEVASILEAIPDERRFLITGHDSLGYFADRYRLEVVGAVVEGGSTTGIPSSARLSALIDTIDQLGIPAVFGEVGEPTSLLEAMAAEPDLDIVVVPIHVDSLGEPGSGAETYVTMMRANAQRIAEALTR